MNPALTRHGRPVGDVAREDVTLSRRCARPTGTGGKHTCRTPLLFNQARPQTLRFAVLAGAVVAFVPTGT